MISRALGHLPLSYTAPCPISSRVMPRHKAPSRLPAFVPVPVRARTDGWTALRQAEFIGWLAETGSVRTAAERVGMARETAYRLRGHAGAESFVAAWDEALGNGRDMGARKVTLAELEQRAFAGTLRPVMRAGRYVGTVISPDNNALLRMLRRFGRVFGDRRDAEFGGEGDADKRSEKRQPAVPG
jgi:hypothetical protein